MTPDASALLALALAAAKSCETCATLATSTADPVEKAREEGKAEAYRNIVNLLEGRKH